MKGKSSIINAKVRIDLHLHRQKLEFRVRQQEQGRFAIVEQQFSNRPTCTSSLLKSFREGIETKRHQFSYLSINETSMHPRIQIPN